MYTTKSCADIISRIVFLMALFFILVLLRHTPAEARTDVSGNITADTTWGLADSPVHVIGNVTVYPGATLSIDPGVVVKFQYESNASSRHYIVVNGHMIASGTAQAMIIFTSDRDDDHGGDSNGDEGLTSGAPGDWGYVDINDAGSVLNHCKFLYGGYRGSDTYVLYISSPEPAVDIKNCTFMDNKYRVVEYKTSESGISPTITGNTVTYCGGGMYITGDDTHLTMTGNTFQDLTTDGHWAIYATGLAGDALIGTNTISQGKNGIYVSNCSPHIANNTITENTGYPVQLANNTFPTLSGNTITENTNQVVVVNGTYISDITWSGSDAGLPFLVADDITVNNGATLTIDPGTIVKFKYESDGASRHRMTINGRIMAAAAAEAPIVFTAERDDDHGGDTNGDQYATSPSNSHWGYLDINNAGSVLRYCEFLYGGYRGGNTYVLYVDAPSPGVEISQCRFEYLPSWAVYYKCTEPDMAPVITGNTFVNCGGGIYFYGNDTDLSLSDNRFEDLTDASQWALYLRELSNAATVSDNLIQDAKNGIFVDNGTPAITGNTITGTTGYPLQQSNSAQAVFSGNTLTDNTNRVLAVSGSIHSDVTWSTAAAGLAYLVVGDITIDPGYALTIEPGTVVKFKFESDGDYRHRMTVNGRLIAQGTGVSPIVFTAERDDDHGGDTNSDNETTIPGKSHWGYVQVKASGSVLEFCEFWYGGYRGGETYVLYVDGLDPAVHVRHCGFYYNQYYAMYYNCKTAGLAPQLTDNVVENCDGGFNIIGIDTRLTLTGNHFSNLIDSDKWAITASGFSDQAVIGTNTITNSTNGIQSNGCSPTISGNTITDNIGYPVGLVNTAFPVFSGNTITDNKNQVVSVYGTIQSNGTWSPSALGLPYLVTGNITVNNGAALTIEPGTVVKFLYVSDGDNRLMMTINGQLLAQGLSDSPIIFTAERDDDHGGDSNGDYVSTTPGKGQWGYVNLKGAGSVLAYCEFWYGGYRGSETYVLYIEGGSTPMDLLNCAFHNNRYYAVYYNNTASGTSPVIAGNHIADCDGGIYFKGSNTTLTATGNTFTGLIDSDKWAIYADGLTDAALISGNTISRNVNGVNINNCSPMISGNIITENSGYPIYQVGTAFPVFSGNTITDNTNQVIAVSGTIGGDGIWSPAFLGIPYLVTGDMAINAAAELTINPGTIVKFKYVSDGNSRLMITVNGRMIAVGTTGSPIIFTAERDDTHGGDSNGDAAATAPGKGHWGYVRVLADDTRFENCEFWYGGYRGGSSYMLRLETGVAVVRRCGFYHAHGKALYYNSQAEYADVLITGNAFEDFTSAIHYYGSTAENAGGRIFGNYFDEGQIGIEVTRSGNSLSITDNKFIDLWSYGVSVSDTSKTIDATHNWWGDDSGPSGEGSGDGVPVSANVDFADWLDDPAQSEQGVFNIHADRQPDSMVVDITYDLVGNPGTTYTVAIAVSNTGGEPYWIDPSTDSLVGAVGLGISPGSGHHILWDAAMDAIGVYTDRMRVKVTADLEN